MKNPNPEIIGSSTEHVNRAEIEMVINGNCQNLKKIGRPNLLFEELLKRAKDVIIGSRLAGTVISRRW